MSGRHQFQELTEDFTPERRRRVEAKKAELLAEMALRELRRAMALTQQDLADRLLGEPARRCQDGTANRHVHLEPAFLYRLHRR